MIRNVLAAGVLAATTGIVLVADQSAQSSAEEFCRVAGQIHGAEVNLPGVAITAVEGTTVRGATSTGTDGRFRLALPAGMYQLRAELTGFSPIEQAVTVTSAESCDQAIDLTMTLLPRRPAAAATTTGRGGAGARFQRLDVGSEAAPALTLDADATPAAPLLLPSGFGDDAAGEAIAVNGAAARVDNGALNERGGALGRGDFVLPPGLEGVAAAFGAAGIEGAQGGFAPGGAGGPGGPGGPGGIGPGGPGGPGGGPGGRGGGPGGGRGGFLGGRGVQQRPVQLTADYTFGGSALDASPYQLRPDSSVSDRPYTQQNFGMTLGGRLKIPGLLSGTRTNFTLTYNGGRGRTLFDQYGTVPTADVRAGDFSSLADTLLDPATGQPFAGNQIPADRINPQAQALLAYIPLPNLPGTERNYHYTTTTVSNSDAINARITHTFGAAGGRGAGPNGRGGGGGFRGRGAAGGRGTTVALNAQFQYRRSDADQANTFSTLGGTRTSTTIGAPISLNIVKGRNIHQINVNLNHTASTTTNQFGGVENVAAAAGILGTASSPFAWGVPALSFSSITSLRDLTPSDRSDRRITASYSFTHPVQRHSLRIGGDVQFDRTRSNTETNANGTFVFTGIYTTGSEQAIRGADVADFLLGLPQQASVQYGPGTVTLQGRSLSAYVNDDWRARGNLTFQLGLRYELLWPFVEQSGHLVNLDVTPDFTAASSVMANATGPYSGEFPAGLVATDTNNLAPRLGVAWRASRTTTIRGGYGISYNAGTYAAIARQLASQPPFATTNTQLGTLTQALLLESALAGVTPNETTNTYGIDKDYQLGRVQTWNVDWTRSLGTIWQVGANYTYTLGSSLDIVRAPNRNADGTLRIEGVQPFLWQTSEGSSVLHSATFRVQRRQVRGVGWGATYTLARSRDNSPSISGGGASSGVVAQNDQDLDAEWALSSFDRRQRLNANLNVDLPFGANRRWLNNGGRWATLLENWRVTATFLADAGTPLTPRVSGAARDVAQGINGALRADYDGEPVSIANPSIDQFFNTGAFSIPAAGAFGTAPRNVIIGPGSKQLNAQLSRDVTLGGTRALTIQIRANNLLNNVNYTAVDTTVNSPTFGQVLSVRPMRSAQVNLRFRF